MAKRTKRLIEHKETQIIETEGVRLNKYLSDAGICSRRDADKLIESGEVIINGQVASVGSKILPGDSVEVKGKQIKKDESLALIAFNKPRGVVCTTDGRDPDNIIDYIKYSKRIYPIGRLDKDSEGLILLTNDGNLVNKILRAGNNHEKEYIVTVNKTITHEFLDGMMAGVPILDTVTNPCEIKTLDKNTFQIILTQGLNRQIRRMCEYFGYKVLTLKRIRIMNVNLGHLQLGGYRNVTEKEISGINELIQDSENAPSLPFSGDKEVDASKVNVKSGQKRVTRSKDNYKKGYQAHRSDTSVNKDKNFNKDKSFDKEKSLDKEKTYDKEKTSDKGKTFDKNKSYDKNKTFGKDKTFGKEKSFNR